MLPVVVRGSLYTFKDLYQTKKRTLDAAVKTTTKHHKRRRRPFLRNVSPLVHCSIKGGKTEKRATIIAFQREGAKALSS